MRKIGIVSMIFLLVFLCVGCERAAAEGGETEKSSMEGGVSEQSKEDSADREQSESPSEQTGPDDGGINVWESIMESPEIPLGISGDTGEGTYPAYQVEISQMPGELVKEVLLGDKDISMKTTQTNGWYPDQTDEYYYCQDGTYVYNGFGELLFVTPEAETWPATGERPKPTLEVFFAGDDQYFLFPEGAANELTEEDLDYATRQQAKQLVAGYLDRLGVEYAAEWEVYAVTAEKMMEAMEALYPEEEYPGSAVESSAIFGRALWNKEYNEEDDVYVFRIPMAVEGHVLTDAERVESKAQYMTTDDGCFIDAMVGREGLRYLEIYHLYTVTGQSEAREVMTSEQAVDHAWAYEAEQDSESIIPIDSRPAREVIETKFSYVPDIEKNGLISGELIPCWEVRLAINYGGDDDLEGISVINVDAASGEIINTSSCGTPYTAEMIEERK